MRLTIVGGGGFRVPLIYRALASGGVLVDEVALYDVDRSRLAAIEQVLAQLALGAAAAPRVVSTTDLDAALDGAGFVFCAIRVGGLRGRALDERVALEEGVLGQETVGLGGVCYGLRTVPVALDIAARIAAVAPQAWVVNFTNPAGMITEAMSRVLGDRVIGICDSPAGLCRRVAGVLGVDPAGARFDYAGLNHLGWLSGVWVDGVDLLPGLLGDDAALESFEEGRLFGASWLRAVGAMPNEYLYYYDFSRDAVRGMGAQTATRGEFLAEQQSRFYAAVAADPSAALAEWRRVRRERESTYMAESRSAAGAGERASADLEGGGYEGVALALMEALTRGDGVAQILNVRGGRALGLPEDAVVEVPCVVDRDGARPLTVGSLGAGELGLVQQVKAVERTAIEAALTGSRELALQAMASHPLAGSTDVVERVFARYLAELSDLAAVFGAP